MFNTSLSGKPLPGKPRYRFDPRQAMAVAAALFSPSQAHRGMRLTGEIH
jgi:hypothetical protein